MIELNTATLYGGGLIERLNIEIRKVLENVADVNTEATKKRKVKLELVIRPNEQRNMADVDIVVSSVLAPPEAMTTSITYGKNYKTGEVEAFEMASGENPNQGSLPGVFEGKGNILTLKKVNNDA
jgi:hypothetical protein